MDDTITTEHIINEIINLFSLRISVLVKSDPECMAYQKILDNLHYKINMEEKILKNKLKFLDNTADGDTVIKHMATR